MNSQACSRDNQKNKSLRHHFTGPIWTQIAFFSEKWSITLEFHDVLLKGGGSNTFPYYAITMGTVMCQI